MWSDSDRSRVTLLLKFSFNLLTRCCNLSQGFTTCHRKMTTLENWKFWVYWKTYTTTMREWCLFTVSTTVNFNTRVKMFFRCWRNCFSIPLYWPKPILGFIEIDSEEIINLILTLRELLNSDLDENVVQPLTELKCRIDGINQVTTWFVYVQYDWKSLWFPGVSIRI